MHMRHQGIAVTSDRRSTIYVLLQMAEVSVWGKSRRSVLLYQGYIWNGLWDFLSLEVLFK